MCEILAHKKGYYMAAHEYKMERSEVVLKVIGSVPSYRPYLYAQLDSHGGYGCLSGVRLYQFTKNLMRCLGIKEAPKHTHNKRKQTLKRSAVR